MKVLLAGTSILVLTIATAQAQSFDGGYAGAQFGYVTGEPDLELRIPGDSATYAGTIDYDGWDGGVFGGYRWVFQDTFVLGGELGANWSNADGSQGDPFGLDGPDFRSTATLEKNDEFYLSLKAGAIVQPNALVYVIGGFQTASFDASVQFDDDFGSARFKKDEYLNGLHVGVGAEYMFTDRISGRMEYKYQDYDSITVGIGGDERVKFEPSESVFRVGVSYNF